MQVNLGGGPQSSHIILCEGVNETELHIVLPALPVICHCLNGGAYYAHRFSRSPGDISPEQRLQIRTTHSRRLPRRTRRTRGPVQLNVDPPVKPAFR